MVLEQLNIHMQNNDNNKNRKHLILNLILYSKTNSKWIKLNVKCKTIDLSGEKKKT